jgi:hypothetical protein
MSALLLIFCRTIAIFPHTTCSRLGEKHMFAQNRALAIPGTTTPDCYCHLPFPLTDSWTFACNSEVLLTNLWKVGQTHLSPFTKRTTYDAAVLVSPCGYTLHRVIGHALQKKNLTHRWPLGFSKMAKLDSKNGLVYIYIPYIYNTYIYTPYIYIYTYQT